ncbi:hypothetical protein EC973_000587 [Apophysomyces ossiformis]|uniref:CCAAT-binding factor domain-containing protein n=1 Tax=Apophysomyces ossiformis TaxID=679940 RepID=A0A8H7BUT6_9FUNG|nr:hypothetical protein EC973_000587 [Apophysomyces ossiformis]
MAQAARNQPKQNGKRSGKDSKSAPTRNQHKHNNDKRPLSNGKRQEHKHNKPLNKHQQDKRPHKKAEAKKDNEANQKLNEQIMALGGTKGDLKFLEDIDLEDNDELVTAETDDQALKSLQNELKSFVKNIGLSADQYEDAEDDEEIEQITDEEEMEQEGEDEEEHSEEDDEEHNVDDDGNENEKQSEDDEETEEEQVEKDSVTQLQSKPKKRSKLLIEPTPHWHQIQLSAVSIKNAKKLSNVEIASKYSYARELLSQENGNAEKHSSLSSSDRTFMSNILTSGTLNDKISALTLLVQESPLHAIKTLDTLMSMTKKKGRKEAVMAIESLKDLFTGSVLPNRKLLYFADQPLGSRDVQDQHLLLWAFEDHLKRTYFEFVQQLEALSHDMLMHVRYSMVRCLHHLLSEKPEQEQNLLKLLVNKLGDAENKVGAKASQLLIELLVAHPGMKLYVVREIEQLMLRPNATERAQYYAVITLNQTILTAKDSAVANKLIELYFVFFKRLLKITEDEEKAEKAAEKKEEEQEEKSKKKKNNKNKKEADIVVEDHHSKTIAAVLTGVNRAFHFSDITEEVFKKHLEVLFKITHAGTFNTAIQALSLVFSISLAKQTASDRFYRTLYESMLDPRLITSSKQAMYLNLLFKAIRADSDLKRVKAFVKRMVQIAGHHQPTFVCGLLYILSQLIEANPGLRAMLTTPEEDDEDEHFVDAPDEDGEKQDEEDTAASEAVNEKQTAYDGRKRDPRFSNADKSCLWELIPFRDHYHPSVAKYAENLFNGETIRDQPDLHHHTLMHFLDRFVYRNPKKQTTTRGQSIMQPLGSRRDGGVLFTRGGGVDPKSVPLNSEAFWRKQVESVPVDEIFFHKYFSQKAAGAPDKSTKKKPDEDDEEDEVWRAMMSSIPGGLDQEGEDEDEFDDEEEEDEEMRALLMEDDDDIVDEEDEEEKAEETDFGSEPEGEEEAMDDFEFMNASDMEEELSGDNKKKRKAEDEDESEDADQKKKKKTKKPRLPTFASYEDYANLIDQDE